MTVANGTRRRERASERSRGTRAVQKARMQAKKEERDGRNRFFPVGPGRGVEPRDRSFPLRITCMQQRRRPRRRRLLNAYAAAPGSG